jgi:hypothetical protein
MTNTMHDGNEQIELVEVPQECLAEVTGGAYDAFMPSSLSAAGVIQERFPANFYNGTFITGTSGTA